LYAYFAVNYYDEDTYNVVLQKANGFTNNEKLRLLFGRSAAFASLSSALSSNLDRQELNQKAFEAALDKDFVDIAYHFI
jgi:hypothetical protein